jgi:hypothetical protein
MSGNTNHLIIVKQTVVLKYIKSEKTAPGDHITDRAAGIKKMTQTGAVIAQVARMCPTEKKVAVFQAFARLSDAQRTAVLSAVCTSLSILPSSATAYKEQQLSISSGGVKKTKTKQQQQRHEDTS